MFGTDERNAVMLAVDLVNTEARMAGRDLLAEPGVLRRLSQGRGYTLEPTGTPAELQEAYALRRLLATVVQDPVSDSSVALINHILLSSGSVPQLAIHPGHTGLAGARGLHLHYSAEHASFMNRFSAHCAMGLAQLIAAGEEARLKECAAPTCHRQFLDLSRNSSRRYCDSRACGNRLHAAQYRARQSARQRPQEDGTSTNHRGAGATQATP